MLSAKAKHDQGLKLNSMLDVIKENHDIDYVSIRTMLKDRIQQSKLAVIDIYKMKYFYRDPYLFVFEVALDEYIISVNVHHLHLRQDYLVVDNLVSWDDDAHFDDPSRLERNTIYDAFSATSGNYGCIIGLNTLVSKDRDGKPIHHLEQQPFTVTESQIHDLVDQGNLRSIVPIDSFLLPMFIPLPLALADSSGVMPHPHVAWRLLAIYLSALINHRGLFNRTSVHMLGYQLQLKQDYYNHNDIVEVEAQVQNQFSTIHLDHGQSLKISEDGYIFDIELYDASVSSFVQVISISPDGWTAEIEHDGYISAMVVPDHVKQYIKRLLEFGLQIK